MKIYLSNTIFFDLDGLSKKMIANLKKQFRIKDPEYIKSDNKQSFSDEEKYISMFTVKNNRMYLPRGVYNELECILTDEVDIDDIEIVDKRLLLEEIEFPKIKFDLYAHQKRISKIGANVSQGTFQAGCGSGKTIALLSLIEKCKQPALVIVPDITLQKQWLENIEDVFGLRRGDKENLIGVIGDGEYDYKNKYIVVATNQSIYSHIKDKELFKSFGFVCMDECHSVGARTFRTSINLFPAYYRYGATATLFRNDNLGSFIEDYCGKCFYVVTDEQLEKSGLLIKPILRKRPTNFRFKINYKYSNWYNTMIKYLTNDNARNNLIVNDILANSINKDRIALVVSTSVNHCNTLAKLLHKKNPKIRIGFLTDIRTGGLDFNNIETINVESKAKKGKIDIVFGVNKVKQGLDIPPIEDVYIVAPRKSQVDITQIVGRVMRPDTCFGKYKNKSDKKPYVYDYVDVNIETLVNQYKEWRLPIYEKRCEIEKENNTRKRRRKGR